jgi:hypothetical protein
MPDAPPTTDRALLCLHIPKTAGSTLGNVVTYQYAPAGPTAKTDPGPDVPLYDGTYWPPFDMYGTYYPPFDYDGADGERLSRARHVMTTRRDQIRVVMGHFPFGIHELLPGPSTYMTVLRDPVDRVVSLYYHTLKYSNNPLHERLVTEGIGLREFVTSISCKEADNDQTRRLSGLSPEFGRCSAEMLEVAKDNLRTSFSLVGITERFDETLILSKRVLGWQRDVHYWPSLVNKSRPPRESLPSDIVDVIAEYNALDAQLYEFAAQLLDDLIRDQGAGFASELGALRAHQEQLVKPSEHLIGI